MDRIITVGRRTSTGFARQILVVAIFLAATPFAVGDDWPQFLGPQRTGISAEKNLINQWPQGGLKVVWRAIGGGGMSGIAVAHDRLFTMIQTGGRQRLVALQAETGKTIWSLNVAPAYKNQMGDGPRATPTVVGDTVYAYTGDGFLLAAQVADGKLKWQKDCIKTLKGKIADYGMACSPLVDDKHVIVTVGGPNGTVAAFDRASGKLLWTAGTDPAGYSSPNFLTLAGRKQLVVYSGASGLGIDPKTGGVLWRYPYVTDYECNIVTPLQVGKNVFFSSGENHGAVMLQVTAGDNDSSALDVKEVWTSQGSSSVLRNEWQTSILLDGMLYGFDNVGSAGPVTHLTCVDATSGQRQWRQIRFGKGNLIAADGKLLISTMKGELVVVKASPKGFDELGRQKVLDTTRQAPALANGRLYLRDGRQIVCLDLRR